MTVVSTVADIVELYAARGGLHYGEGVTQIEHAVQCAVLAETSSASAELIVASLLHDIGHLLIDPTDFSLTIVTKRPGPKPYRACSARPCRHPSHCMSRQSVTCAASIRPIAPA